MSGWTFATGDALTRLAWGKKYWIEAKTQSYFYENGFVGKDESNIIVDTNKSLLKLDILFIPLPSSEIRLQFF